ncbi:MAG: HAMP domain-containing histidine kinase [Planctomycetes bacterium]|nr:HAMP domain-containing histidine kinase [Planctomycetota bacterium]
MTDEAAPTEPETEAAPALQQAYRAGALIAMLQWHWFIRLRWAFIFAALAVLALERFAIPETQRPWALVLVIFCLAGVNLVWMGFSRFLRRRFNTPGIDQVDTIQGARIFANAQVASDLFLLTAILHFAGGVESPMAVFYLFHMVIGSLLLQAWHAIAQGCWAVILYAGLALAEWARWLGHYPFLPTLKPLELHSEPAYVAAAIAVLACGVFGTLIFTLQIASRLDDREVRLRRAHEALQQSQTTMHDLEMRRSRFMQTAAHQLKGPLASIQTMIGLIRDKVVPEEAVGATCDKIMRRCREGIEQVTELLTLARVKEADPKRHGKTTCDLGEVVLDSCQRYATQAETARVALSCRVPKDRPLEARVERMDLRSCVDNLVDNAIKYTPGPGTVSVVAGAYPTRDGDMVYVKVKDSGVGIDPEVLTGRSGPGGPGSIFDAFRRGNEALARGIPGTGLGLAIVREIVEQAGGQIRVHSQPTIGSTFTISFPAEQTAPAELSVRNTRSSEIVFEKEESEVPPGDTSDSEETNHAG